MAKRIIKSAEEAENQFELDEQAIDEISNAEEFADVEVSNEDVMDAVQAIGAIADTVIEKADAEEKSVDADALLDEIRDLIDDSHEDIEEEEVEEEEELPEELMNSAVRVMISEDGEVELESTPDEVYDSSFDDMPCTVFDTCEDVPLDVEETAPAENTEEDVLVIGNSAAKTFKKGYVVLKSSTNKKAWSAAYKKVKKMVGSSKLKAAHWAIVSALAKKEEEEDKKQKKIECKLIKYIRNNAELKTKFYNHVIKSDVQDEIQPEGQTESEVNQTVEETAGQGNPGFEETTPEAPSETGEPEGVTSTAGDPVEDPSTLADHEGDIVLPEENIEVVEVALTNSRRKVQLKKIRSSKSRNYNLYKVTSKGDMNWLDGRVVKSAKYPGLAFAFKSSFDGVIVCAAKFVDAGKSGMYKPVLVNNKVVISKGVLAPVFQNYERILLGQAVLNSRNEGIELGMKRASIQSRRQGAAVRRPVVSARKPAPITSARKPNAPVSRTPVRSNAEKRARASERQAIQSKMELQQKYEAEERAKLFQSSQTQMNEEKIAIKSSNARNSATLDKIYKSMF